MHHLEKSGHFASVSMCKTNHTNLLGILNKTQIKKSCVYFIIQQIEAKWPRFYGRIRLIFWYENFVCDSKYANVYFKGSSWQLHSIRSDNDRQVIILTNDGVVYWRIYASFGPDQLIHYFMPCRKQWLIIHISDLMMIIWVMLWFWYIPFWGNKGPLMRIF